MATESVSLFEMVDLALGTPEVGAVNFNVLHSLLYSVLQRLELGHLKANLPSDPTTTSTVNSTSSPAKDVSRDTPSKMIKDDAIQDGKTKTNSHSESLPVIRYPFHQLQDKVDRLEKKFTELEGLPTNHDLIEKVREGGRTTEGGFSERPRPMAELWQGMQLAKKVDTNTEGVGKLMSLAEDLMKNLHNLSEDNDGAKKLLEQQRQQINELKSVDKNDEILSKLKDLEQFKSITEERLSTLEKQVEEVAAAAAAASEAAAKEIGPTVDSLVTWSALEDALNGIRQQLQQRGFDDRPTLPYQPVVPRSTELLEEHEQPTDILHDTGNQAKPSRPSSRSVRSGRSCTGPSPELQDLLQRLGKLSDKHHVLEKRVDTIENDLVAKADKADIANLDLPADLSQQLQKLFDNFGSLNTESNKELDGSSSKKNGDSSSQRNLDNSSKKNGDSSMLVIVEQLKTDLKDLNDKVDQLSKDGNGRDKHISGLTNDNKQTRKGDVDNKENNSAENKASQSQLDKIASDTNRSINDLQWKLHQNEGAWKKAIEQLSKDIDGKVDRLEFKVWQEEIEKQQRLLNKRLKSLQSPDGSGGGGGGGGMGTSEDDAAGIRKQLLQRFNCISCDKPVDMMPHKPVPALPLAGALPGGQSLRPYVVYDLDQIRQFSRGVTGQQNIDPYARARTCGGTHTLGSKRSTAKPSTAHPNTRGYSYEDAGAQPSTNRDQEEYDVNYSVPMSGGVGQIKSRPITKLPDVYGSTSKPTARVAQYVQTARGLHPSAPSADLATPLTAVPPIRPSSAAGSPTSGEIPRSPPGEVAAMERSKTMSAIETKSSSTSSPKIGAQSNGEPGDVDQLQGVQGVRLRPIQAFSEDAHAGNVVAVDGEEVGNDELTGGWREKENREDFGDDDFTRPVGQDGDVYDEDQMATEIAVK